MQFQKNFFVFLASLCIAVAAGCSNDSTATNRTGTGGSGQGGAAGFGGEVGTGGSAGTGGTGGTERGCLGERTDCSPVLCPDGNEYDCGDCIDNDGDGCFDDLDPECLGPCDDTEGPVLLTGTPGQTGAQCGADCYFDRGNGSGSGECKWDRRCDPEEPKDGCTYDGSLIGQENYCPDVQPDGCEEGCGALTPNGCDCFGCCTFPQLQGAYVFLGSFVDGEGSCTLDDLDDPVLCRTCTPAGNCLNTCETCELCLGKTELPPECFPGTGGSGGMGGMGGSPGERCPEGKQVCGLPGDAPCPAGAYCLTGCCTEIVVQ